MRRSEAVALVERHLGVVNIDQHSDRHDPDGTQHFATCSHEEATGNWAGNYCWWRGGPTGDLTHCARMWARADLARFAVGGRGGVTLTTLGRAAYRGLIPAGPGAGEEVEGAICWPPAHPPQQGRRGNALVRWYADGFAALVCDQCTRTRVLVDAAGQRVQATVHPDPRDLSRPVAVFEVDNTVSLRRDDPDAVAMAGSYIVGAVPPGALLDWLQDRYPGFAARYERLPPAVVISGR